MPKFIPGANYETVDFHIRYGCAYSPMLRKAIQTMGADIKRHIETVVEDIDGNEEVANSLKHPMPGFRECREVDICAAPGSPAILKCFVEWFEEQEMWMVFAEGAMETYWEEENQHGFGKG
jgi:hypothetical protein